ncbi:putative retrotransposon hot spot (RHS) protein [Trypanosoma cruzi]|nr:putative retrotransposon hot spot (RHS) protein [Trypanosoma cruzi]
MTLVGLRMTTACRQHKNASTVWQFAERLAAYFNGWEELSRDMLWEIIYVQHKDCMPMNGWQRCDVVHPESVSDAEGREMAVFWKEKVRQYQVSVPCGEFGRDEALRSAE